jgi:UDP-N-acetyl-D-mannosaminuronic acid dehydrogenase
LENKFYKIKANQNIKNFITEFEKEIKNNNIDLAIYLNSDNSIKGIISLGDLRRLVENKVNSNDQISKFLNKSPIVVKENELNSSLYSKILLEKEKISKNLNIKTLILLDSKNKFKDILKFQDLESNFNFKKICIVGMGHIGLPLAVHLLKKTDKIYGIDKNKKKIYQLSKFKLNFYEKDLDNNFLFNLKSKKLIISSDLNKYKAEVYIICIGTEFNNEVANNKNLYLLAKQLGKKLKLNDLVILRGTVQVGATRQIFLKGLLKTSKLQCGKEFYLSYMPERLVEGRALEEIEKIPNLISGFTQLCLEKAILFAKTYFSNYLPVESLEEAEIIKLTSNTYRDFKFAFANEINRIANQYKLSGFSLIKKANFGYERNDIPLPSIGVGGFCLPKDPYLFSKSINNHKAFNLNFNSRKLNDINEKIIFKRIKFILESKDFKIRKKILICGVAFKGYPETLDTRNSVGIKLGNYLSKFNYKIDFIDPLSKLFNEKKIIEKIYIKNDIKSINQYDGIIVVNNHDYFSRIIMTSLKLNKSKKKKMIFDTWSMLSKDYIKKLNWEYYNL